MHSAVTRLTGWLNALEGGAPLAPAAVGLCVMALGVAVLADLPEACVTLGRVAAAVALYAALLPVLIARLDGLCGAPLSERRRPLAAAFALGGGVAFTLGLPGSVAASWARVLLLAVIAALAFRTFTGARLRDLSLLPDESLVRVPLGLSGLAAAAGCLVGALSACGGPDLSWLSGALVDGVLLAVVFYAALSALAEVETRRRLRLLPARWPDLLMASNTSAVGVALVQGWLGRYPGARPTALLVVALAPAIVAAVALLRGPGQPAPDSAEALWRRYWALPGALLLAQLTLFAGATLRSLNASAGLLGAGGVFPWPWGWQVVLALVAACAYAGLLTPGDAAGLRACPRHLSLAGLGLLVVSQGLLLEQSPLSAPALLVSGALLLAASLLSSAQPRTSAASPPPG